MTDLTARLTALLDRSEISATLVRFARALDEKDWSAYADLYAEDGVLSTSRATHRGRTGLAEHVAGDLGGYVATHHVTANHDIAIDGDTASVRSSLHATHVRSSDPSDFWMVGGWYDTTLRRTDDGWEITSVKINPVWRLDPRAPVPGVGLSAVDWIAIQNLYARYAQAIDGADAETFASLFIANAVFHHPDGNTTITDLAAFCRELAEDRSRTGRRTRHWAANLVLSPTADGVKVDCTTAVSGTDGHGYITVASGSNVDEIARFPDGTWRFASRRALPDLPFGP